MGLLQLFNLVDAKSLLISDSNRSGDFTIAYLVAGKVLDTEFYAIRRTGDIRKPYSRIAPAAYTVAIGVYLTSDASQLAYQNDAGFTPDAGNGRKLGSLNLSTPAINTNPTILAGGAIDAYIAIDLATTAGPDESYRQPLKIYPALNTAAATVPPATEIAATQAWVKGLFMALNSPAGLRRIARDDDGNPYEIFMGTDGQEQIRALNKDFTPPATP